MYNDAMSDAQPQELTKICTGCQEEKPYSLFYRGQRGIGGRRSKCKQCDNERTKVWASKLTKEKHRQYNLHSQYKMTIDDFNLMRKQQSYRCAICDRHEDEIKGVLGVDHDHRCCPTGGKSCGSCIRALLCNDCNTGLGKFGDDISILKRAIEYISSHTAPS